MLNLNTFVLVVVIILVICLGIVAACHYYGRASNPNEQEEAMHQVQMNVAKAIDNGAISKGYSIIVHSASVSAAAAAQPAALSFALRVGKTGSPWSKKPRGTGLRGSLVKASVGGLGAPPSEFDVRDLELTIRITPSSSSARIIGEATVSMNKALANATQPMVLPLLAAKSTKKSSSKKQNVGTVTLQVGPPSLIIDDRNQNQKIQPALFESLGPAPPDLMQEANVNDLLDPKKTPIPYASDALPEALQGIFWIQNQDRGECLATWAGTGTSGAGVSAGILGADGTYLLRPRGARTYLFPTAGLNTAVDPSAILTFQFDDRTNPTFYRAAFETSLLGKMPSSFVDLTARRVKSSKYPTSIVWQRKTTSPLEDDVLGPLADFIEKDKNSYLYKSGNYLQVQIVDKDGNKREPAFTDFVNNQAEMARQYGVKEGSLYYYAYDGDSTGVTASRLNFLQTAKAGMTQLLEQSAHLHTDNIVASSLYACAVKPNSTECSDTRALIDALPGASDVKEFLKGMEACAILKDPKACDTFIKDLEDKSVGVYGAQGKYVLDMMKMLPGLVDPNVNFATLMFGQEYNEYIQKGLPFPAKCPFKSITHNYPGNACTNLNANELVRRSGPALVRKLDDGTWTRNQGGALGYFTTNPYLYQFKDGKEGKFVPPPWGPLSPNPEVHAKIRDFMSSKIPQETNTPLYLETQALVQTTCQKTIEGWRKAGTIDVGTAFPYMVVQLLYGMLLGEDMPEDRATFYAKNIQSLNLIGMAVSGAFPASLYDLPQLPGFDEASMTYYGDFMQKEFETILGIVSKPTFTESGIFKTESEFQQLAMFILVVLSNVGTLSIPQTLTVAIALNLADEAPPGAKEALTKLRTAGKSTDPFDSSTDLLDSFIYETVRLFPGAQSVHVEGKRPTCAGLSAEEMEKLPPTQSCPFAGLNEVGKPKYNAMEGSERIFQNLNLASRDPAAFGPSVNRFELRPLKTYETYNVTWAEQNVDNSYKKGSRNRNCMGKTLTFLVLRELLPEFLYSDAWTLPKDAVRKPKIILLPSFVEPGSFTTLEYHPES